VTEAGYDSAGTSAFFDLMDPLAAISRVCAYDRAGTGTSDPRPSAHALTVMDEAAELHALLQGAGVEPPYVLVGHSFGGFVSRLFATAYPDETAGLLLIESSHEDEILPYRRVFGANSRDAKWIDGGDRLDIDETATVLRGPGHDLGDLPLIVLRAERYDDVLSETLWRRTQADLATISTDSIYAEALGSGHVVINENRIAVLEAVTALVEAGANGTPLAPCEEVFTPADVRCLAA
jgi:pimeloyl-ACP methyl ester carboxylesterase